MVSHTEDGIKTLVLREQDVQGDIGAWRDEVNRNRKRLYNEEIYDVYNLPNVIGVTKSRMRRSGHIAHTGDRRGAYGFGGKT